MVGGAGGRLARWVELLWGANEWQGAAGWRWWR